MDKLPFRQVHLDFHTGDCMPDVGSRFSEEDFERALTEGHVNSITLFAKCHHGWSYHPTEVNRMHPTLRTDLLGRQLSVCEKLGVRAQIYLSAGFDERMANEHPEYMAVCPGRSNDLREPCFHLLCLNNDRYLELLTAETEEVLRRYAGRFDGLFFDICSPHGCVCSGCITDMTAMGLDPAKPEDVQRHDGIVYRKFTQRMVQTVRRYDAALPVFFNCGNIPRDDREAVLANTAHLELESLPTGGWGYDHFPLSAAYARCLGREYLGMTGKFHRTWGEFGGFKHPNALIYETSLSLAFGAKCSVGDQLHPLGCFDHATYRMIGRAYALVEQKEAYCRDVTAAADIALYTACGSGDDKTCPDIGANRMLLEGHYLFDVIDGEADFSPYRLVIFPDTVRFDETLAGKTARYLEQGGRILLTGVSGLTAGNTFFTDFGVEYLGENGLDNNYFVPDYDGFEPNGRAAYLMYARGQRIGLTGDAEVPGLMQNSYFNRAARRFCSHSTTPNDPEDRNPAVVIAPQVGYIAWDVFTQYGTQGAYHLKRMTLDVIEKLLGEEKTLRVDLPSGGVTTLMHQKAQRRYIHHLLYGAVKLRGSVEVIEDAIPLENIGVSLRMRETPKRVYMAPEGREIPFRYENGLLTYTVERFVIHGMVVIEY